MTEVYILSVLIKVQNVIKMMLHVMCNELKNFDRESVNISFLGG